MWSRVPSRRGGLIRKRHCTRAGRERATRGVACFRSWCGSGKLTTAGLLTSRGAIASPLKLRGRGRVGALRRCGQVEVETLLLCELNELPHVGELAAVAVAELVEDDPTGLAAAGRHLQQIDELLRGQAARRRF